MKLESLERHFVFRISRGLYLTIAALALLSLIGSLILLIYSISPTLMGSKPKEPNPPSLATVNVEEIKSVLKGEEVVARPVKVEGEYEAREAEPDPEIAKINNLMAKLHSYFPSDEYPWGSTYKSTCTRRDYYSKCREWKKEVDKRGVNDTVNLAMSYLNNPQKISFMESLLLILSTLSEDMETRFLGVKCISDICIAFKEMNKDVYDTILVLFRGEEVRTSIPENQLSQLSDQEKITIFQVLLNIKKGDSKPDILVSYLKHWNAMISLFPDESKIDGMETIWGAIKYMHIHQVDSMMNTMISTIQAIPSEERAKAAAIYYDLLNKRMNTLDADYRRRMSDYYDELEMIEAKHLSKKFSKKKVIPFALYGLGSALGGVALLGMFLGLLGIERNTRILEKFLEKQKF